MHFHFWIDPLGAERCCRPQFQRIFLPPGAPDPGDMLPGNVYSGELGRYVWVPCPRDAQRLTKPPH